MDWFDSFIKVINLKPRYLLGLCLVGIILLLAPVQLTQLLGIDKFLVRFKGLIAVITVFAFVFFLVQSFQGPRIRYVNWRYQKKVIKELSFLSSREREIFAYCLKNNQKSIILRVDDPVARALEDKGLLTKPEGWGDIRQWPWSIPQFVWDHILRKGIPGLR
ncbi:MAG: super-infection exclusion protein B [Candidatus Omnitrophica bacterium]|nr:super-infection exclusion protein B [Candidatus Omnitrophota bacterium]MDD5611277.1 super-infection exclusion protein B [Candidatus Omnitrophota bacterium]